MTPASTTITFLKEILASQLTYISSSGRGISFDLAKKGEQPLFPHTQLTKPLPIDWYDFSVKVIKKTDRFAEVELRGAPYLIGVKPEKSAGSTIGPLFLEGSLQLMKMAGTNQWKIYSVGFNKTDSPNEGLPRQIFSENNSASLTYLVDYHLNQYRYTIEVPSNKSGVID